MEPDLTLYDLYKAQHRDLETAAANARQLHIFGRSAGHGDGDHSARKSLTRDRALASGASAALVLYTTVAGW